MFWLRSLEVILSAWPSMLLGTGLVLVATGIGWLLGEHRSWLPVRWMYWWVSRVVLPLLKQSSWWGRSATIFVNNTTVLSLLVAVGVWRVGAACGVVVLGVGLGIGVRLLADAPEPFNVPRPSSGTSAVRRVRLGVALNMFEPPAIIAAIGLSLGRTAALLSAGEAWTAFAAWVVPALLIAAGGEALWLGAGFVDPREAESDADSDGP